MRERHAPMCEEHGTGGQQEAHGDPGDDTKSPRRRPKERHELRRRLPAFDYGSQDQGEKNHAADPTDRGKDMKANECDIHSVIIIMESAANFQLSAPINSSAKKR